MRKKKRRLKRKVKDKRPRSGTPGPVKPGGSL
jgi:hypothetical protein